MAAPTYLKPTGKFLVVTIVTSAYTGITPTSSNIVQGYVESVGIWVTLVGVGQYIMFENQDYFKEGTTTWALIHQDKINSVITPLAP